MIAGVGWPEAVIREYRLFRIHYYCRRLSLILLELVVSINLDTTKLQNCKTDIAFSPILLTVVLEQQVELSNGRHFPLHRPSLTVSLVWFSRQDTWTPHLLFLSTKHACHRISVLGSSILSSANRPLFRYLAGTAPYVEPFLTPCRCNVRCNELKKNSLGCFFWYCT